MRAPVTINTIMYPYNYHLIKVEYAAENDCHYAYIGDGYADETIYKIYLSAQEAEEIDLDTEGDLRNFVRSNNATIIK